MSTRAWLDLEHGVVVIGAATVPCTAVGSSGDVCVDEGVVLRPVPFEVRTQAAWRAGLETDSAAALAASLLTLQTVKPAPLRPYDEVVSLVLAGAGDEGRSFSETLTTAVQATGLAAEELLSVPASRVDDVARQARGQRRGAGWKTILFADPGREVDWALLRDEFASRLLRRVREQSNLSDLDAADAAGPTDERPRDERAKPGVATSIASSNARASALATRRSSDAPADSPLIATAKALAPQPSAARVRLVGSSLAPVDDVRRPAQNRMPQLRRFDLDTGVPQNGGVSNGTALVAPAKTSAPTPAAGTVATSARRGTATAALASSPHLSPADALVTADPHAGMSPVTMAPASTRIHTVTRASLEPSIADAAARSAASEATAGDLADLIADLLNREADLRGID